MAYYKTVRATMSAAVNTPTPINLDLDGNTVAGIIVPAAVKKLVGIMVTLSASIVAVASAGVTVALRLAGDGLTAQQEITIGGAREDTTSTGGLKVTQPFLLDTDIDVIEGNTVKLSYALGGVDPGSPEIAVTLIFA